MYKLYILCCTRYAHFHCPWSLGPIKSELTKVKIATLEHPLRQARVSFFGGQCLVRNVVHMLVCRWLQMARAYSESLLYQEGACLQVLLLDRFLHSCLSTEVTLHLSCCVSSLAHFEGIVLPTVNSHNADAIALFALSRGCDSSSPQGCTNTGAARWDVAQKPLLEASRLGNSSNQGSVARNAENLARALRSGESKFRGEYNLYIRTSWWLGRFRISDKVARCLYL